MQSSNTYIIFQHDLLIESQWAGQNINPSLDAFVAMQASNLMSPITFVLSILFCGISNSLLQFPATISYSNQECGMIKKKVWTSLWVMKSSRTVTVIGFKRSHP